MRKLINFLNLSLIGVFVSQICFCNENNPKQTKIIIENSSGKLLKIQKEVSPNLLFEAYESKKIADTIYINSHYPFRLVCSDSDSAYQYIYNTFILNPGETIYLKKNSYTTVALSKASLKRNNELAFFTEMQEKIGNFEGLMVFIPHKRKEPTYPPHQPHLS